MARAARVICRSEDVQDGGTAYRFEIDADPRPLPAFVVRHRGAVRAYVNQCAHIPVELDWQPGQVFDRSGLYLICATHGALYDPENGRCLGGPCRGRGLAGQQGQAGLRPIAVTEREGDIVLMDVDHD